MNEDREGQNFFIGQMASLLRVYERLQGAEHPPIVRGVHRAYQQNF